MEIKSRYSVINRLGQTRMPPKFQNSTANHPTVICKYWLAGNCTRNPCRFLHSNHPPIQQPKKSTWINPNLPSSRHTRNNQKVASFDAEEEKVAVSRKVEQKKLCKYWVTENCVHGENCKDLHKWFLGSGISLLTKLERRHNRGITGIALPSGSDKLFSGSKDGNVCIWDCNTGGCVNVVNPGQSTEIGCLISEGSWVFVGLNNAVKAWNFQTVSEVNLLAVGLIKAMVVGGKNDDQILFGGSNNGSILAWKYSSNFSNEPIATLKGHVLEILSLIVGANCRLYSGSKDESIRVWDIRTFQCLQILKGHTDFVTSLICWDQYLLSGSLDRTIKVWGAINDDGDIGVIYEVKEESGVIALGGIEDSVTAEQILLCSCKDSSVRLYELPSFVERGRIFSKADVETIQRGCGDLFFTGDATGELSIWKLVGESKVAAADGGGSI